MFRGPSSDWKLFHRLTIRLTATLFRRACFAFGSLNGCLWLASLITVMSIISFRSASMRLGPQGRTKAELIRLLGFLDAALFFLDKAPIPT